MGPFGSAFPSGHATQSATLCVALVVVATLLTRSRALRVAAWVAAFVIIVLVGVSRVYLRDHWASDVLGGWLLASIWVGGLTIALRPRFTRPGSTTTQSSDERQKANTPVRPSESRRAPLDPAPRAGSEPVQGRVVCA